jgi:magnesium chelatase family protein
MAVKIYSAQIGGLKAHPVTIEVDITPGLHIFAIVGLADKEVQESRERIGAAIKNLGALPPHKKSQRVIVNLAPADIRKEGPAFDLPIALGFLLASGQINFNPEGILFMGELGLDGTLRKTAGALSAAILARLAGFHSIFLPKGNGAEASVVEGINIFECENIKEIVEHLEGRQKIPPQKTISIEKIPEQNYEIDFADIKGQAQAKRVLEIAAAGGHNVLMQGPPGTGKTLLAKSLPSILPPMELDEAIEVTNIYSVAGLLKENMPFLRTRPFRSPHHTASPVAIIGGGQNPKPGEITLAHRGVLFLDEFPEFTRPVLEALRQPLEDRTITVSRAQGTITFPADIMMIASMNPCPCGNFGNPQKDCVCPPSQIAKYQRKISGPLLDRIDIHIDVPNMDYEKFDSEPAGESSEEVRKRVAKARALQRSRFLNDGILTNSEMSLKHLKKHIRLSEPLKELMRWAAQTHSLSARSYYRVLKIARTIADLAESKEIERNHILEALQYRPKQEL